MSAITNRKTLYPYSPPQWAEGLNNCPDFRLKLFLAPTPIERWTIPRLQEQDFRIFIKRDDLVGGVLCGTKARKMEFLMAKALQQGCDNVVTMGGECSNHCRITAAVSRQLGLIPHLLMRSTDSAVSCKGGNVLIDRLMGSKIVQCPCNSQEGTTHRNMEFFMDEYADMLRFKGANPFVVNLNRLDFVGIWGYIEMFRELMDQDMISNFTDVVVAVASGATVIGLAIANYLSGSNVKIHGMCVCDSTSYFYADCNKYIHELGLHKTSDGERKAEEDVSLLSAEDLIDLMDYKSNSQEEQDILMEMSTETGILLDEKYTVKAVRAMVKQVKTNPSRFKGKDILFIHTGGLYTLFNGDLEDRVKNFTKTNEAIKFDNNF